MRKKIIKVWLSLLLIAILTVFWYNAWVYALPTPVPSNYVAIRNGTKIHLPKGIKIDYNKPVFLHFFNPDCPCSRFNLQQFTSLVNQYGTNVNFIIVPVTKKLFTSEELQKKNRVEYNSMARLKPGTALWCLLYSTSCYN